MQNATAAYRAAIVAPRREIVPRIELDMHDPEMELGACESSSASRFSRYDQLQNKNLSEGVYPATLERNRWKFGRKIALYPPTKDTLGEHGYMSEVFSGAAGAFSVPPTLTQRVTGVQRLEGASIVFGGEGCPTEFKLEVLSGGTVVAVKAISKNRQRRVDITGFSALNVDALRFTFLKFSLPFRRVRVTELVVGFYELLGGGDVNYCDVLQETSLDATKAPYGVATIKVLNKNHRFNPFAPSNIFRSIQEGQAVGVSFGAVLPGGNTEYLRLGKFYQHKNGWRSDGYDPLFSFSLVDIIGLMAERSFTMPATPPTTLDGWIRAALGCVGKGFAGQAEVAANLKNSPVTGAPEELNCAEVARCAAMAAGGFLRADSGTGKLKVETLSDAVRSSIALGGMLAPPQNSDADAISEVVFRFGKSGSNDYTVTGTNANGRSLSIKNPFITTQVKADEVGARILSLSGGGMKYIVSGRGDMAAEVGDLDTIATGFGTTATARRYKQQFTLSDGVMTGVRSEFLGGPIFPTRKED